MKPSRDFHGPKATRRKSLTLQFLSIDNESRWQSNQISIRKSDAGGAGHTMASALDGITVLELSRSPAAAMAGMFLGDHGARVIRLLDGDAPAARRGGYLVWDRGKACRRLDLSLPSAAPYERLIRNADVVLEDFPPFIRPASPGCDPTGSPPSIPAWFTAPSPPTASAAR